MDLHIHGDLIFQSKCQVSTVGKWKSSKQVLMEQVNIHMKTGASTPASLLCRNSFEVDDRAKCDA
jgi:hypothetical protein